MKKTLYLGALLVTLSTSAYALPLEVIGKPHSALSTMQSEGRHIEIKDGLRQLIPQGFRTLVHRDVMLPPHINWKAGQDWVSVLESMAKQEHLTVKLDWSRNIVYIEKDKDPKEVVEKLVGPSIDDLIRKPAPEAPAPEVKSAEVSAQKMTVDGEKSAHEVVEEDKSAPVAAKSDVAAHPAPVLSVEPKVLEPKQEQVNEAAKPSMSKAQAVATPKVEVVPQEIKVEQAPLPQVKQSLPKNESVSAVDVPAALSLSTLFNSVARSHSAEVVNYASDAQLSSALVPPGLDLAEDLSLIHRALGGSDAPVSIRVYRRSDVFEVVPAGPGQARFEIEMKKPYAGPLTKRVMPVYPRS